jgi:NH3-dependent NAD+ synthetase
MSTLLSVVGILCGLAVAGMGFAMREVSALSYAVLAVGIVGAVASSVALMLNRRAASRLKKEIAQIRNVTNVTAHSLFGGI